MSNKRPKKNKNERFFNIRILVDGDPLEPFDHKEYLALYLSDENRKDGCHDFYETNKGECIAFFTSSSWNDPEART